MHTAIWKFGEKILENGIETTFNLATIFKKDDKKFVAIFSIGDNATYIYDKKNKLKQIIQGNKDHLLQNPDAFNKTNFQTIEVEDGDKIVCLTDGILEFMSDAKIAKALAASENDAGKFLELCKISIMSNPEDKKKEHKINDSHNYDDISAAILVV